jgi:transposase
MPKTRALYPAEFRQQIIELAQAGRHQAELSREFAPTSQSIINRVAQAAPDASKPLPGKDGLSSAERDERNRLRREGRQFKMERDILAKAGGWFARKSDVGSPNSSNSSGELQAHCTTHARGGSARREP